MKTQTQNIRREYCAWEPMVIKFDGEPGELYLRGDLAGKLNFAVTHNYYYGWFEFPARGEEQNYYEIVRQHSDSTETVVLRANIQYYFDDQYFSPRWENVDQVNIFLAQQYSALVSREIIYTYDNGTNIQLLRITDNTVALKNKQVILLTGRVHNPESGMTSALYRFIKWLLEQEGQKYLSKYCFLLIPLTIPLTFDEDPRQHNVNREWQAEITEPDLAAIRDLVIDKYIPEIWIDCHSFNEKLMLDNPAEQRKRCGDYIVAHPVGENFFDQKYSEDIALRLIHAGEQHGHLHRDDIFFTWWAKHVAKNLPCREGENISTEHHNAGIFSAKDYAKYADRVKFGVAGRNWPAMACEYGHFRCHAINMCLECKPLHVGTREGTLHYSSNFPNSHVVKLKELCKIGLEYFHGQPFDGFPCNIIVASTSLDTNSLMLCASGDNREEIRRSRRILWQNRHSIIVHQAIWQKTPSNSVLINIECFRKIVAKAVLRIKPKDPAARFSFISKNNDGININYKDNFCFVPITITQGINSIELRVVEKNNK